MFDFGGVHREGLVSFRLIYRKVHNLEVCLVRSYGGESLNGQGLMITVLTLELLRLN